MTHQSKLDISQIRKTISIVVTTKVPYELVTDFFRIAKNVWSAFDFRKRQKIICLFCLARKAAQRRGCSEVPYSNQPFKKDKPNN